MNLNISKLSSIDDSPKIRQYLEHTSDYIADMYDFNVSILSESSNDIMKNISSEDNIKALLTIINTIIDKYISYLNKLVNNFVKEYKNIKICNFDKDKLSNLKTNYSYIFNGYNFTITKSVPNIIETPNQNIFKDFYKGIQSLNNENNLENVIDNYLSRMTRSVSNGYNTFRGETLNSKSDIDSKSFQEFCFMCFRNGMSEESKITLNYKDIKNIANRNYRDIIDSIIYTKEMIINELNRIKNDTNQFNEILKFDIIKSLRLDSPIHDQLNKKLITILKLRISQIADISSIYTILISDKMNAACKLKIQDSQVLSFINNDASINESYYTDDISKIIDEAVYDIESSNNISNILEMHQLLNREELI